MVKERLMSRSMTRMRGLIGARERSNRALEGRGLEDIRTQLKACAERGGGVISARRRAERLVETYLNLDDEGKKTFFELIAFEFGPDFEKISQAHAAYQEAADTENRWSTEYELRQSMRSKRLEILTQFNALPHGVKFLVDMRADLLRLVELNPLLKPLDNELADCLAAWFDVGFLELQLIKWSSPAILLEKLVQYEAVHEIRSWHDLKNRLDSDRRCYAFFHPRMPMEPLIFVEVALLESLADNIESLLDVNAPLSDVEKATTAIFYSISSTQRGLRGISFGNFLIKMVVEDLRRDFPRLRQFATLSPMPGLLTWARSSREELMGCLTSADWKRLSVHGVEGADDPFFEELLDGGCEWMQREPLPRLMRAPLLRLAGRYLLHAKRGLAPRDSVARFHIGNGARIERLNWLADTSTRGLSQSWGIMVNYMYAPDRIEANLEAFAAEGRIDASSEVKRYAKR